MRLTLLTISLLVVALVASGVTSSGLASRQSHGGESQTAARPGTQTSSSSSHGDSNERSPQNRGTQGNERSSQNREANNERASQFDWSIGGSQQRYDPHRIISTSLRHIDSDFYTPERITKIAYGSFLLDVSRLWNARVWTSVPRFIRMMIAKKFMRRLFPTLWCEKKFRMTRDNVGVYLPEQHVDFHVDTSAETESVVGSSTAPDDDEMGPVSTELDVDVDRESGMATYIYGSVDHVHDSLVEALNAFRQRRQDDCWIALGKAFHTLQDFYTNTNIMQLAMIYGPNADDVYPWVGEEAFVTAQDRQRLYPLIAGMYFDLRGSYDLMILQNTLHQQCYVKSFILADIRCC